VEFKWYQYFSLGAWIAGWFGRAFSDGIITKAEQKELIAGILEQVGSDIKIE